MNRIYIIKWFLLSFSGGYETYEAIQNKYLRRAAARGRRQESDHRRLAGKCPGSGLQLCLPGAAGLLRHHSGSGGDRGHDEAGQDHQ